MEQSRWRSPVAIAAIAALLFFIVKTWVGFDIPEWDRFIELLLAAGIAVGVFNNPTDAKGW